MANTPKIFQIRALKLLNTDYTVKANFKVIGSAAFNFAAEWVDQMTGPSPFTIESEINRITTEGTISIGEYTRELLDALLDANNTVNSLGTTGLLKDVTNRNGTLVMAGGNVITALALSTTAADIKSGFYRLSVANQATKMVQLHALSSPDLKRNEYEDFDTGLVKTTTLADGGTAVDLGAGIRATNAATVTIPVTGGANWYTTLRVFAPGEESYSSIIGQEDLRVQHYKMIALSREIQNRRWYELLIHRAALSTVNFNFAEEFSTNEITGKLLYSEPDNAVAEANYYRGR